MPRFKYNGDHEKMKAYGFDFSGGKIVDIPLEEEFVIGKLMGNSHFDQVDSDIDNLDDSDIENILDHPEKELGSETKVQYAIFKKKKDGSPYSAPEKIFDSGMELYEIENYVKDNYDNPDDYLIMKK
jgi:hypothetical protein